MILIPLCLLLCVHIVTCMQYVVSKGQPPAAGATKQRANPYVAQFQQQAPGGAVAAAMPAAAGGAAFGAAAAAGGSKPLFGKAAQQPQQQGFGGAGERRHCSWLSQTICFMLLAQHVCGLWQWWAGCLLPCFVPSGVPAKLLQSNECGAAALLCLVLLSICSSTCCRQRSLWQSRPAAAAAVAVWWCWQRLWQQSWLWGSSSSR